MKIDFNSITPVVEEHFRGGLKAVLARAVADESVRIINGTLEKGASIGMHTHTDDFEVMYIIMGEAESTLDGMTDKLSEGMCQYCPKGHSHDLVNVGEGDLVFLGVVPKA